MKWYYTVLGGHTHVRVFMNGGKCGDLCFRNEEFQEIQERLKVTDEYTQIEHMDTSLIRFIPDAQDECTCHRSGYEGHPCPVHSR